MKGMLTIAKKSNNNEFIRYAYDMGFTDFRLNMDYEEQALIALDRIRTICKNNVTVFADFQGVKMRIQLPPEENDWEYHVGDLQDFYLIQGNYPYIKNFDLVFSSIKKGQIISIADGKIEAEITDKTDEKITVRFTKTDYVIRQNAGCCFIGDNIPDMKMTKNVCLEIADNSVIKNKLIDWVILSFVTSASEITDFIKRMHNMGIKVMAKIETIDGVNHINEISDVVDGFMIGRGDLTNTAKSQFDIYYSKALNDISTNKKEFSGVGTFFLSEFSNTNVLSEYEKEDLFKVKDKGLDYVMLSKEVVNSKYPYETVRMLKDLCK